MGRCPRLALLALRRPPPVPIDRAQSVSQRLASSLLTPTPMAAAAQDDLRPQFNQSYGQHQMSTPNIDRISQNGVTFTRAYCQQVRLDLAPLPLSTRRYTSPLIFVHAHV